ncbi:MAG: polysaccharide biosynthesis C-terminal domain-containing protein [Candidatus Methanomethyliaceae archaeon]
MLKIKIPGRYRAAARNSIGLLLADLVYRLSNFATVWLIARYLGPIGTGIYSLGSTVRATLQIATLAGTGYLIVRELSRNPTNAQQYLMNFAGMRFGLSLGGWLLLCLVIPCLHLPYPGAGLIISVLGLELIPESIREITRSGSIAQQRVPLYTLIASSTGVARIIACWGALITGGSLLEGVASIMLVSWIGNLLGFLKLLSASHGSRTEAPSLKTMKTQLGAALPFLAINTLLVMYAQSNIYLLSLLSTIEELAFYSIADSIVASSSLLTQVYLSLAIPAFSKLHPADYERLKEIHSRSLLIFSSLSFPLAAAVSFQARTIATLWGEQFQGAALAIGLLIWSLVLSWLNAPNSGIMIATGHERVSARFLVFALGVNVFAGFILIPSGGAVGAVIARLTAELIFWSMQWLFVYKKVSQISIGAISPPLLAVIAMGLTRFLLGLTIRTWEALCISLFVYVAVLLVALFLSRR